MPPSPTMPTLRGNAHDALPLPVMSALSAPSRRIAGQRPSSPPLPRRIALHRIACIAGQRPAWRAWLSLRGNGDDAGTHKRCPDDRWCAMGDDAALPALSALSRCVASPALPGNDPHGVHGFRCGAMRAMRAPTRGAPTIVVLRWGRWGDARIAPLRGIVAHGVTGQRIQCIREQVLLRNHHTLLVISVGAFVAMRFIGCGGHCRIGERVG